MKINEKEYKLSYTGETLLIYKEEFNKDMIMEADKLKQNFDFVSMCEFVWSMAKTNDKTIPPFKEFMASIKNPRDYFTLDLMQEMIDTLYQDGDNKKEVKKKKILNLMRN